MKVKFLGHSAFLITSEKGTRILTDPYTPGGPVAYAAPNEEADIVTVSHEHGDHNNVAAAKGDPTIIRGADVRTAPVKVKGIEFKGIACYHNAAKSTDNTIICFEVDGLKVCHLGDLGHSLESNELSAISKVDVLFVPVGGKYTVDAEGAKKVTETLKPRIAFPMHYETDKCKIGIDTADKFAGLMSDVQKVNGSEIELKSKDLPAKTRVIVLTPAC